MPRIFATPNTPYQGHIPQTTPRDLGAGVFGIIGEIADDLRKKQQPIDLDRLKSEYDLEMDKFKRELPGEPDTDQWEQKTKKFEAELRAQKLGAAGDPITKAALNKEILKDYARNVIDVRVNAGKMKASQQLAYVDTREFEIARQIAEEQDPTKRGELIGQYRGMVDGLATGKYPSITPEDAAKRKLKLFEKVDEQRMVIGAERDPLNLSDRIDAGDFPNADPAAKERALNIADRVITQRDRRESKANKARADIAERVYRDQAQNKELNEAQFDAAAAFYKFDQTTIDNIKKLNLGIKMPTPYGEKLVVDAMEPVNKVDVGLADIRVAEKNLQNLAGKVDSTTPEYRQAMNRLRFLNDILTPGTPANKERQQRGDARRRLNQLMMQYDLRSETELKGQLLGQIETMPVQSIPAFMTNLEAQWKARQLQGAAQLQGIKGLRSLGERK